MSSLGTLGSWLRDALLCGALMAFGAILPVYVTKVHDVGPARSDLFVIVGVTLAGAAVGAFSAAPLWAASRLCWRLSPLLSMALGPCAGALSALLMFYMFGFIESGRLVDASSTEKGLLLGFGAFALAPPWVGYLAVRAKERSAIGIVLLSGVWAMAPSVLLLMLISFLGY